MIGRGKQMYRLLIIFFLSILFLTPVSLYSNSQKDRPHGDKSKLPKGCASCHIGHGKYNTPMLSESEEVFCFRCHGYSSNVEKTMEKGDLAKDTKAVNIQREFEKPYRHPIEKSRIHRYGETLPEIDSSIPRHVTCSDCHHHHYVEEKNKSAGIKGTDRHGTKSGSVSFEYELCFNCHSDSANLPADQTNKTKTFDIANPSFHPVIAPGRNNDLPSLIPPLTASSVITCTDCHNSDDLSGPRGLHGSTYKYILAKNFSEIDGPEGIFQYELCYSCHSRSSILGNESFQLHSLHVTSVGTSCRTCHNPHGSTQYAHLIDFDNISIRPSSSGYLEFRDFGIRAGECFLSCHGKDHDPSVYPAQISTPSSFQLPSRF